MLNSKNKAGKLVIVFGAVVVFAGFLAFFSTSATADKRVDSFPVNASNQTFGSVLDAPSPEEYPDLIAATATNGKDGYLLKVDYERVMKASEAANPEEAVAMMTRLNYKFGKAFKEYVLSATGISVEQEAIENVISEIGRDDGHNCPYGFLSDKSKDKLLSLLPDGYKTDELASAALLKAFEANDTSIPVYELDGKTVIGEFVFQ